MAFATSNEKIVFPEQKRQKMMVGILAVVFVAIGVVLYFGFFKGSAPVVSEPLVADPDGSVSLIGADIGGSLIEQTSEDINFDAAFLKEETFQDLKAYGELPDKIIDKGRTNPFTPY